MRFAAAGEGHTTRSSPIHKYAEEICFIFMIFYQHYLYIIYIFSAVKWISEDAEHDSLWISGGELREEWWASTHSIKDGLASWPLNLLVCGLLTWLTKSQGFSYHKVQCCPMPRFEYLLHHVHLVSHRRGPSMMWIWLYCDVSLIPFLSLICLKNMTVKWF